MSEALQLRVSPSPLDATHVALLGLGEVGTVFGHALVRAGAAWVGAWDIQLVGEQASAVRKRAQQAGVVVCADLPAMCAQADVIISAVTAANTLSAAQQTARHLRPGTWFLDLNSVSPTTKTQAAAAIHAGGGRYVEAAVMSSVPPYGMRVPMLIGGPHATALLPTLRAWGMTVQVASDRFGVASATKMCRSVLIKGLEALVIESYTAARHYGVEEAMLASLHETFPGIDWEREGNYFFQRVAQHGRRRAEEMREVARTVAEAGFTPLMSRAIAEKDDWMANQMHSAACSAVSTDAPWRVWADALRQAAACSSGQTSAD